MVGDTAACTITVAAPADDVADEAGEGGPVRTAVSGSAWRSGEVVGRSAGTVAGVVWAAPKSDGMSEEAKVVNEAATDRASAPRPEGDAAPESLPPGTGADEAAAVRY